MRSCHGQRMRQKQCGWENVGEHLQVFMEGPLVIRNRLVCVPVKVCLRVCWGVRMEGGKLEVFCLMYSCISYLY